MKNFLIILSCLFYVQNAYCDNPPFNIESMNADYIAGKIDLATAIVLCKKIVNYANVSEIDLLLPYTDGDKQMWHSVELEDCKSWPDLDYDRNLQYVWYVAMSSAKIVVETGVKEHSQCHQSYMERLARSKCGNEHSYDGYTIIPGTSKNIDCSKTDNRCVVSRPASKGGKNKFYNVCCLVPIVNCESTTSVTNGYSEQVFSGTHGNIQIRDRRITDIALSLSDYGYDCKPNIE